MQRSFRLLLGAVILVLVIFGFIKIFLVLNAGPGQDRFHFHVLFKDVRGLRVGSAVKHRGMRIGEVAHLELDLPTGRVRVLLRLVAGLEGLVHTTTQVWIVRPRFSGFAKGLSGLETLIKDSYLRLRSREGGERLRAGGEIIGLEEPPADLREGELEDAGIGDLLATVFLPHPHGLQPGSPVLFRGIETGEVRRVRLAERGQGVLLTIRVDRPFRSTVTEKARFWVARPILKGNLITGITLDGLGSLLRPALVHDNEPGSRAGPAQDGAFFTGLPEIPGDRESWKPVEGRKPGELLSSPRERGLQVRELSPWVEVRYMAIEKDFLKDDQIQARGEGVLFFGSGGRLFLLTSRSACDGSFFLESHWYDRLRIQDERIRVMLEDGRVLTAQRIWSAPGDRDLTLCRVHLPAESARVGLPAWETYLDFEEREHGEGPGGEPLKVLREAGRAWAVHGRPRAGGGGRAGAVPFSLLPQGLRPLRK